MAQQPPFPEERDLAGYTAAIPSIMLFLDYANDLLSFYKEEGKAGDYPGFIQNLSSGLVSSGKQKKANGSATPVLALKKRT
jgi:hypothetical protein